MDNIPLCDLRQQYQSLRDPIDRAMQQVAEEGAYILGPNVKQFEAEVAAYLDVQHAIAVGSGTDALHLTLRALGIGPGDEVITTPFTFVATTEAIGLVGATPVFVDIDPDTFNIDVHAVERALTSRTKAILPVHLYGMPCDMKHLLAIAKAHRVAVVEDTAQAMGAEYSGKRVGSLGVAGCLSFFPSKNLGCFGDGGMVATNDTTVYERVEMLRRHGGRVKYHHEELGVNSRLDELQAAILRVKLPHLDEWNRHRRRHAQNYDRLLAENQSVTRPYQSAEDTQASVAPVFHQYTVQVDNREHVIEQLRHAGVGCAVYYPVPLHLQGVHSSLGYKAGDFPHAERAAERCLSLPMFPELTASQQERVCNVLAASQHTRLATDQAHAA